MKRVLYIVIVAILFGAITVNAYSVLPITYWYSHGSDVGHWTSTPTISRIKLNNNNAFYFEQGYTRARSQWSSAGVYTSSNGTSTSSNIVCRGGTVSELVSASGLNASDFIGVNGLTSCSSSFQDYLDYNGIQKNLYRMSSAKVCIIDN